MVARIIVRRLVKLIPLLLFTAILLALLMVRLVHDVVVPIWAAWLIGALGALITFDYLVRFEVFKQIGGLFSVFLAVLILIGALVPLERVERSPHAASNQLAQTFESTWNALYQGNLFNDFSPKQLMIDSLRSIGDIDPFRTGKLLLFAIFGFAIASSFLFPMDPVRAGSTNYLIRLFFLCGAGLIFALQVELLQVLSRTRTVTAINAVENMFGVLMGFVAFVPVQILYAFLADHREKGTSRFNVLGVGIDAVNMNDCLRLFERIINGDKTDTPAMTAALGVAGIIESRRNPRLQRILNQSVLNTPDGMPLVWLGKLFGYRRIERVYGPDLLRDVCAYSADKGWKHYFYGAAPGIVEKLKAELERQHPNIQIVGIHCPPFRELTEEEENALAEEIARRKPDIFWIGISTPRQLYFMDQIRRKLDCKIICPVGYAFDVNAGVEIDAPDWIKYAGLQWLHRAIKQPRLWKRYLPDNPRFICEVLLQLLHLKRYPMFVHECPCRPVKDDEGYPRFPAGVVSLSAMSLDGARDRIMNWAHTGQRRYVNVCTADTTVRCFDQPALAKVVMESGMATTDGMPLVWLARAFGFREATRVYGPDLMLELCRITSTGEPRLRHYFYGSTDETIAKLKTNLLQLFPDLQIAGAYAPPFRPLNDREKEEVADRINAANPDIVWCGLGTPKQDYWVAEFRPLLNATALIAIGAAFDFHAKRIRQAPRWMMRAGLEWTFRLYLEPRRLWRRYIIGNPRFIFMVLSRQLWRLGLSREGTKRRR